MLIFCLCRLNILPDLDNMAQDIRKALESCQKELKSTQEQKSCIEKECIVYKSQLEVLNSDRWMEWIAFCFIRISIVN